MASFDPDDQRLRHTSAESDLAEGCSQLVRKKRRRENGVSKKDTPKKEEDKRGATLQNEVILSKAMEEDIQQLRERVDDFTHQVHLNSLISKLGPSVSRTDSKVVRVQRNTRLAERWCGFNVMAEYQNYLFSSALYARIH